MLAYSSIPVMAYTKEESVYSKLDNNGIAYQTIVSNHLKNTEKSKNRFAKGKGNSKTFYI